MGRLLRSIVCVGALFIAQPASAATISFQVNTGEIWRVDFLGNDGGPGEQGALFVDFFSDPWDVAPTPPASFNYTFFVHVGGGLQSEGTHACNLTSTYCSGWIGDNSFGDPTYFLAAYVIIDGILGNFRIDVSDTTNGLTVASRLAPVPLPAALPLFLSALALLGWMRRRTHPA